MGAWMGTVLLQHLTLALRVTIGWSYTTVLPKGVTSLVQRIPSMRLNTLKRERCLSPPSSPYALVLDAFKSVLARREERRMAAVLRTERMR